MERRFIADYKTADGWYHNAHIMYGSRCENMSDEAIVAALEAYTCSDIKKSVACVFFIEIYQDSLSIDDLLAIQEGEKDLEPGVSRAVIADQNLLLEWLKPEEKLQ